MTKFNRAIVRPPGPSLIDGITSADLGPPDYEKALIQHSRYIGALEACHLEVTILPPDNSFPDSTFVEDTALLTPGCAIITRPGAPSRRGETGAIEKVLINYFPHIEKIDAPGTVEAGDIMMVGNHYYIGLSQRTNAEGVAQVIRILNKYGMTGSKVPLRRFLHLKSGASYLENENMVLAGEFIGSADFAGYNIIAVDDNEMYAANCLWLNGTVLVAKGYPKIRRALEDHGYRLIELDMSEFRKLDGGLSCLSLRF